MKKKHIIMLSIAAIAAVAVSVIVAVSGNEPSPVAPETDELDKAAPVGPQFMADSAYAYCEAQCQFGPRTMNSEAHEKCASWIEQKFRQFGCDVEMQRANLTGYDGTILRATNIIARHNPKARKRILICAHWDSRPWADNDPDTLNWRKPVMAANDGASGVAVMLEVARLVSAQQGGLKADLGIDFVCFDAEDWGTPQWADDQSGSAESWALGAQHWAQSYANANDTSRLSYGILLDMVGGEGAQFYHESYSKQ